FDGAYGNIVNNQIGGGRDGASGMGNRNVGVSIYGQTYRSYITANFIRYSAYAGVQANIYAGAVRAITSMNAIYGNAGPGIDIGSDGPTPNDEIPPNYDTDGIQNYPVVTSVTHVGRDTVVNGYIKTLPNSHASIEL